MTPEHLEFNYNPEAPLAVREVGILPTEGVIRRNLTYATPFGIRRAAYIVSPEDEGIYAAILYVHWYEPESPYSNRTQFLEEATLMARQGAVSLLVETMWSDRDWFIKRSQADDRQNSIQQVIELRLAMDLLLAQPGIDPQRFAYVGHDFGAMYGVLAGSIDPRPTCYVLMAGAPHFADWYLYYPKLEGEARQAYVEEMADFDPVTHVVNLSPAPLFFQFARDDFYVPEEKAQAFYAAAAVPKQIAWYEAGHGLNEEATEERVAWLGRHLHLQA